MNKLAVRTIRLLYYAFGLLVMLAAALAVAVPYFTAERANFRLLVGEIEQTILAERRKNLANIVERTIREIAVVRAETAKEFQVLVTGQAAMLAVLDLPSIQAATGVADADDAGETAAAALTGPECGVAILDPAQHRGVWDNGRENAAAFVRDFEQGRTDAEAFPALARVRLPDGRELAVFVGPQTLDRAAKARAKPLIRSVLFDANRYVWVNEVRDYAGGEGYAVRVVHPNLPETEGSVLSTQTPDIAGNFPYKVELEGVKRDGKLFFEYYFKKMDSDEVTRKLAYAQLYKPFDWIVATGTHFDDIDAVVERRKQDFKAVYDGQIANFIKLIGLICLLYVILLCVFERKLNRMIELFFSRLQADEAALRREKNKLDVAYQELEQVAYIDFLTGLLNRRAMYERIKAEAAANPQAVICLVLADIDHFKAINDDYGHDAGDAVLTALAGVLRDNVRKDDFVSRWGGEEFLILARGCDNAGAVALAEKLRAAVAATAIPFGGITIKATMTLGVVEHGPGRALDEALKEVDRYLYAGKRASRDCVISKSCPLS